MPKQLRVIARTALRPLPIAITLAFANGAMAQEAASPYYFGASQAFTHDDNVYHRPDSGPIVADTVSSTGLLGGIDQPFGRQRFYANGNINTNRHRNQKQLDNTSYGLSGGLDWSTIERLSGTVRFSGNQSLANYGDVNASTTTERNLQKSRQFSATARYGLAASLGLEGGVNHGAIEYTAGDDARTVRQNGANLGVRWGRGGPLSLGLSGHVSTAKYPRVLISSDPDVFAPDDVKRRDIQLSATYTPTGISTFGAHISATRETHLQPSQPNFSGLTGGVSWDYNLSGKLTFSASLNRDTGTATAFLQVPTSILPDPISPPTFRTVRVENNRLTTSAMLGFNYELTGKIQLNGDLRRVSSGTSGAGTLSSYALGARYQPTRTLSLGANVSHEGRSSSYSANTLGINAQLTFR